MPSLPDSLVRAYDDGPDWPCTKLRQKAERAYRDAFLEAVRDAARWTTIDHEVIRQAWAQRRRVRRQNEVLVPSAEYYGDDALRGHQVAYKRHHVVPAARARGRVHGFEFVRQCWEELVVAGVDQSRIAGEIVQPWIENVVAWVETEITPDRLDTPRLADDALSERQRRMLEQARTVIANSDSIEPQAILRRLNEITREELEWLWPGRIPLGKLTLLAGDPGLGKSFVTLDLAARVSRGDAWPDLPLVKQPPGGVVLMNCEDDASDTIAPRLDKAGVDDTRIVLLEGVKHLDRRRHFSLETDLPRLEEVLAQFPETRLVIIDPIAAYCGNIDSHKNSDVRGMLAPLGDLASRHRVAVLAVTHLSKSGGAKAVYRAMGSLAFAAAARAVWAIAKDGDDPDRRLFLSAKLNLAKDPDGLAYRIIDARVVWEFDPVKMHADEAFRTEFMDQPKLRGSERAEAAEWLCEFLADGPVPSTNAIETGKQFGFSERTLRRASKEIGVQPRKESFDGPWLWQFPQESDQQDDHEPSSD